LGRGWIDAVHPDDREGAMQSWQENLARNETYYHEHRLHRADGEYRDLAVRGVPLLEPDGGVREWVGTMTDITERKQTARDLEAQASLLREQADLLALVNETVIVRDPQDNVISWNRAAEKMYGFSRDESISRVTHDLREMHFASPETRESVRAILERDGVWEGELTHVRHDGSRIVVLSRQALQRKVLLNGQAGEPLAILEVNWDISERKRSEQILRESESRFRWLAEATPQMVCVSDMTGKLSYVNQAYSDFTGIKLDEARSGLPELVHSEDRDLFAKENTQARKNGTTLRHELRIRSASTGQYRWFLHQLVPARDHAGEIIWWFGTSTDIHAQKEAKLSLLKTLEQQKCFVSDASHEFRAPLTAKSRTHGSDPGGSGLGLPIAQSIAHSHGGEISLENQTAGGIRAVVKLRAIERN
jgi:PAS domain S-box-containing protein